VAFRGKPIIVEAVDHRSRIDPNTAPGAKPKKQFDLFVRWEFGRDAVTDGVCQHCNEPCGHEVTYSWVGDEDVPRVVRDHYWLIHKKFTGKHTEGVEPAADHGAVENTPAKPPKEPKESKHKDAKDVPKEAPKCKNVSVWLSGCLVVWLLRGLGAERVTCRHGFVSVWCLSLLLYCVRWLVRPGFTSVSMCQR
jgi:hypothetical protein